MGGLWHAVSTAFDAYGMRCVLFVREIMFAVLLNGFTVYL